MNHYARTPGDERVWEKLYRRQIKIMDTVSYVSFKKGLQLLDFDAHYIPSFDSINERLQKLTGWTVYPVEGLTDNRYFFEQMQERRFGSTDSFHDLFGHIPLLTDPFIADFLEGMARVASHHLGDDLVIEQIARLYGHTIESGLVQEGAKCKIYGAGILSSMGEPAFCLSDEANRKTFHLEEVLNTPRVRDKYQEQYFVLYSMTQLKNILKNLEHHFSQNN